MANPLGGSIKQLAVLFTFLVSCSSTFSQTATTQPVSRTNKVETVKFESKLLNTTLPYDVVLPAAYDESKEKGIAYPVLYLLHGLTGHYSDWTQKTLLAEYANQYRIIIVTPEGKDGWYTDSATVPTDRYETYIVQELIPDVQRRFRTNPARQGRAIAGLSMGGYGALKFGIKYRDKFVFAGSLSGALDAASWTQADPNQSTARSRSVAAVFGQSDSATRQANDLTKLYGSVSDTEIPTLPFIYLDCGTEDNLLQANRAFEQLLLERKIPHEFRLLPGGHSWNYWDRQVIEVLRIASKLLKPAEQTTH
jgi:S-formylglutathione hydrolase FrmB